MDYVLLADVIHGNRNSVGLIGDSLAIPNFLRPHEVEAAEEDKAVLQRTIDRKAFDQRVEPPLIRKSMQAVDKRLQQAPPVLTKDQEDKAKKRIDALESELREGMLSHEELRRNPPGALAQNLAWETANKSKVLEWKNLQLALYRGMSQTDCEAQLNIARLRPRVSQLNMDGAQIPAKRIFGPGPNPKYSEGWERIFGSGDQEKDDLKAQLADLQAELEQATKPEARD